MLAQASLPRHGFLQTLSARFRILRPWAFVALAAAVTLSFLLAESRLSFPEYPAALIVVLLIGTAAFPLNDALDLEGDRIAHPNRPLVKGELTEKQAKMQGYLMLFAGIFVGGWFFTRAEFIVIVLCAEAVWFYSPLKMVSGLVGNFLTAILSGIPLVCGVVSGPDFQRSAVLILFGVVVSCLIFSREIVKDVSDMRADRDFGKTTTLPLLFGVGAAFRTAAIVLLLAGLVTFSISLLLREPLGTAPAFIGIFCLLLARKTEGAEESQAKEIASRLKLLLLCSVSILIIWAGVGFVG